MGRHQQCQEQWYTRTNVWSLVMRKSDYLSLLIISITWKANMFEYHFLWTLWTEVSSSHLKVDITGSERIQGAIFGRKLGHIAQKCWRNTLENRGFPNASRKEYHQCSRLYTRACEARQAIPQLTCFTNCPITKLRVTHVKCGLKTKGFSRAECVSQYWKSTSLWNYEYSWDHIAI